MTALSSPARPAVPALPELAVPRAGDVVALQAVQEQPSVSVLLSTRPGPAMPPDAAVELHRMVDTADRRLRAEASPAVRAEIVARLHRLAQAAAASPVRQAVALFASTTTARAFTLPVPVRDRVVVDPTFATRDLVRSLHRTPLHALLLLTAEEARLFSGSDDVLVPAPGARFPLRADAFPSAASYLRTVDGALAAYLRARPSPVVVAGVDRLTAEFLRRSRATTRVAGTIPGSHLERSLPVLAALARPVMERYLASREQESLRALAETAPRRIASGVDRVWLASRSERPEMLVVEQDLFHPARVSDDGDSLLPADDPEAPDVLDDAVDEIIEAVLRRGGWVALASPRALAAHGGIALTVRDR